MYVYIYIYISLSIYIYIEREPPHLRVVHDAAVHRGVRVPPPVLLAGKDHYVMSDYTLVYYSIV